MAAADTDPFRFGSGATGSLVRHDRRFRGEWSASLCPVAASAQALTDASRGIWGVLRTGPPSPSVPETDVRGLATVLGGLVTVGSEVPDTSTLALRLRAHATEAECLAAAIRRVPSAVGLLAWLDGVVPAVDWPAAIVELSSELGDYDAALFAAPVTDAVKQVHGGRIRRGVARDSVCVPVPPILIRTAVARSRLLEHLDRGEPPIAALSASGLTVRAVPLRTPIKL